MRSQISVAGEDAIVFTRGCADRRIGERAGLKEPILDYAQDLAAIGKGLDEIGAPIEVFQRYPTSRMTPEQQGQSIANAGSALIREAAQKFDRATQVVDRERYNLANANRRRGTACYAAAAETKKPERCTIIMPAR